MSKKSSAELAIAKTTEIKPRLEPHPELTEYERSIWISVVDTRPSDFFQADTAQILKQYCKHCSQAMIVSQQLDAFDPHWLEDKEGMDRFDKLNRLLDLNTKQINALSRSMRLTQQSQYDTQKADRLKKKGLGQEGKKPWQI